MNDNLHPLFKNILKGITPIPNKDVTKNNQMFVGIIKVNLKYEGTQYQLEQLVEYLTHNGFLITELKQEDYNE